MGKPKTFEEAQEQFEALREALKEAKNELREFMVENKIKKDKTPEDPKLAKKFEGLTKKVDAAKTAAEQAKESVKELKPKKVRETKYEYPDGLTDKEKKKFRAKMRREAKAGEKKEKGGDAAPAPKKKLAKKEENEGDDD
jgi:hypothetical protein